MAVKVVTWKGAYWLDVVHKGRRKRRRVGTGKTGKKAAELAATRIAARLAEGAIGCFATDWAPGPSVDPPACSQGEGDSGQPDEGGRIPPGPADRPGRPLFGAGATGTPGRGQNGGGSRRRHDAPTVGSDRDACR